MVPSLGHSTVVFRRTRRSSPWCRGRAVTGQVTWFPAAVAAPVSSSLAPVRGWWVRAWRPRRRPSLGGLRSIIVPLFVVHPPDMRLGGPGRLRAGLGDKLSLRLLRLVECRAKGRGSGEADVPSQLLRGKPTEEGAQGEVLPHRRRVGGVSALGVQLHVCRVGPQAFPLLPAAAGQLLPAMADNRLRGSVPPPDAGTGAPGGAPSGQARTVPSSRPSWGWGPCSCPCS